jgi:osmotically inducible protein OsmC
MAARVSEAQWEGNLRDGSGRLKLGSGVLDCEYTFASRFEMARGTNPEELIGAAHAGCFSMALSGMLSGEGYAPKRVHTTAKVYIEKVGEGFEITKIELVTEADVPEIDDATFQEFARQAKAGCPVSKALAAVPVITLEAKLVQRA